MLQVFIFIVSVLLANVSGWTQCESGTFVKSISVGKCCGSLQLPEYTNGNPYCRDVDFCKPGTAKCEGYTEGQYRYELVSSTNGTCGNYANDNSCSGWTINCVYQRRCIIGSSSSSSPPSSSSAPPGPPLGGGCGFCQDTVDYSEFPPQIKHVVWHCDSCTAGRDGIANEAAGCSIESIGLGSCEDNNECPSGVICMDDSTFNYDCYATVGATVYVRNRKNGNVFSCEADGSCDMALKKVASGECRDPSQPPEDPNNPSSSGSGDSSSSGEPNPESSSDENCDLCDKLGKIVANTQVTAENTGDIANYTQETMNKAIDIYNQQTEMQIDLSHVRTNTENTATNTGNIDTKLSTTNSLLNDIKNKNWSPQIHVGSPDVNVEVQGDTNIVTVTADTSRSPFEILNFLKGMFGDTANNYNENDTLGIGGQEQGLLNELDSLTSGGDLSQFGDSLAGAVQSVKTAIGAYKDSLNRGAFSDSVQRWGQQLVNNGVLSGSGSNGCPSVFTRNYTWNMGRFGNVQIGSFGTFLCQDFGLGMTLWALARMVLRSMVAIACMLWLYRTVIGANGGDDEED